MFFWHGTVSVRCRECDSSGSSLRRTVQARWVPSTVPLVPYHRIPRAALPYRPPCNVPNTSKARHFAPATAGCELDRPLSNDTNPEVGLSTEDHVPAVPRKRMSCRRVTMLRSRRRTLAATVCRCPAHPGMRRSPARGQAAM